MSKQTFHQTEAMLSNLIAAEMLAGEVESARMLLKTYLRLMALGRLDKR